MKKKCWVFSKKKKKKGSPFFDQNYFFDHKIIGIHWFIVRVEEKETIWSALKKNTNQHGASCCETSSCPTTTTTQNSPKCSCRYTTTSTSSTGSTSGASTCYGHTNEITRSLARWEFLIDITLFVMAYLCFCFYSCSQPFVQRSFSSIQECRIWATTIIGRYSREGTWNRIRWRTNCETTRKQQHFVRIQCIPWRSIENFVSCHHRFRRRFSASIAFA